MSAKVMLAIGVNNGIGFKTSRGWSAQDIHVVMLRRSLERGAAAQRRIEADTGRLPDLLLANLSL